MRGQPSPQKRVGKIMNHATPKVRKLARSLLALEAAATTPAGPDMPAAFRVCEKLGRTLGRLAGVAGFRSLLSRALALAAQEVSWLQALRVGEDGSLEGLVEAEAELSLSEVERGERVLVAQLITLFFSFLGEALTMRLLQEWWAEVRAQDLDPASKRKT
jgi:hypothetical protein